MRWVSKKELEAFIGEYGSAYDYIAVQVLDENGETDFIDLISDHESITDEIGMVLVIPPIPDKHQ